MSERLHAGENQAFQRKREAYYRSQIQHALDYGSPLDMLKQLEKGNLLSAEEIHGQICNRIHEGNGPIDSFTPLFNAQLRAVDYLYGTDDLIESEETNPLVDILALVAHPKFNGKSVDFQLTAEGIPLPKPLFAKAEPANKGGQRTFDEYSSDRQEYRTITAFGTIMPTTIRGLYIMAEASKAHPSILRSALAQYESLIPDDSGKAEGTAVGLLEILHNAHLLYDRRFYNFATQLRDIVFDQVKDYSALKNKYAYTIITEKPFWYRGEKEKIRSHDKFEYIPAPSPMVEQVSEASYSIPQFDTWTLIAKKRAELTSLVRKFTLNNSLKKSTPNFSPEKALKSIKQDQISKATCAEELRNLELKQSDNLKKVWRKFIEDEIGENFIIESEEVKFVEKILSKIVTLFTDDKSLSQKAKTNFSNNESFSVSGFYGLKTEALLKDPLFHWILAMRIPETRRTFRDAVGRNPESITSFHLFLRLLTYETARVSFHTKELNFLFDSTFTQKMSPDKTLAFLDSILDSIQDHVPDVRRLTKAILPESRKVVSDLLKPERLNRVKNNLNSLKYRDIFGLKSRIPKAIGFAEEDREFLKKLPKKITAFTAYLAFFVAVEIGVSHGIGKLIKGPAQETSGSQASTDKLLSLGDGKFPKSIADRIPDSISPEDLAKIGPADFGEILHFPRGWGMDKAGAQVGYFPWGALVKVGGQMAGIDSWVRATGQEGVPSQIPFSAFVKVDDISKQNPDYSPNQLAYVIDSPNPIIYPPIGWQITKIYQEGGSNPTEGSIGELYYTDAPVKVLIIVDSVGEITLNDSWGRVKEDSERLTNRYDVRKWFNGDLAATVNSKLAGDPALQQLHSDFINELQASFSQGPDAEMAVIKTYTNLYAYYTVKNRFYSLSFQVDKTLADTAFNSDASFATLESLAEFPDRGYFCSVAAYAFRDFMASAGVATAVQPGITLYNYQNHLIGSIAHENNIVYLPDGYILEIDMTPYSTDKTPQVAGGKPFTEEDIKRLLAKEHAKHIDYGKIAEATLLGSGGLLGSLALTVAGSFVYDNTKRKIIADRIERSLAMNRDLTGLEKDLMLAASGRLSLLSYDDTFPETASQLLMSIEAYDRQKYDYAISWLSTDGSLLLEEDNAEAAFHLLCLDVKDASAERVEEIRRNLPHDVFEDIQRYNQGAETIECPYDFSVIFNLSKILYDKDSLELARDVYQRLGVTISGSTDIALRYKVTDVLDLLKRRYASKKTSDSVKPLFNGMYNLINNELSATENAITEIQTS